MEYISKSLSDTQKIAAKLAKTAKKGDVFLLKGNLGAGKTAFAAAFINSLLPQPQNITSPTFNIVQVYKAVTSNQSSEASEYKANNSELIIQNYQEIWHFDLYRLKSADELCEIGLEEALEKAICLIEWPEIAQDFLKNVNSTLIQIEKQGEDRVVRVG